MLHIPVPAAAPYATNTNYTTKTAETQTLNESFVMQISDDKIQL